MDETKRKGIISFVNRCSPETSDVKIPTITGLVDCIVSSECKLGQVIEYVTNGSDSFVDFSVIPEDASFSDIYSNDIAGNLVVSYKINIDSNFIIGEKPMLLDHAVLNKVCVPNTRGFKRNEDVTIIAMFVDNQQLSDHNCYFMALGWIDSTGGWNRYKHSYLDSDTQFYSDMIYEQYRQSNQKQGRSKTVPINSNKATIQKVVQNPTSDQDPGPSTSRQFNEEHQHKNQLKNEAYEKSKDSFPTSASQQQSSEFDMQFPRARNNADNKHDNRNDASDYLSDMLARHGAAESDDAKRKEKPKEVLEYLQIRSELGRKVHEKLVQGAKNPNKILPRASIVLESIGRSAFGPIESSKSGPGSSKHGRGESGHRVQSSRNVPSDNSSSQNRQAEKLNQNKGMTDRPVRDENSPRLNPHSVPLKPPTVDNDSSGDEQSKLREDLARKSQQSKTPEPSTMRKSRPVPQPKQYQPETDMFDDDEEECYEEEDHEQPYVEEPDSPAASINQSYASNHDSNIRPQNTASNQAPHIEELNNRSKNSQNTSYRNDNTSYNQRFEEPVRQQRQQNYQQQRANQSNQYYDDRQANQYRGNNQPTSPYYANDQRQYDGRQQEQFGGRNQQDQFGGRNQQRYNEYPQEQYDYHQQDQYSTQRLQNQNRPFDNQNRLFGNQNRSFDNQNRSFGNQNRSFGNQNRSFGNQNDYYDEEAGHNNHHSNFGQQQYNVQRNQANWTRQDEHYQSQPQKPYRSNQQWSQQPHENNYYEQGPSQQQQWNEYPTESGQFFNNQPTQDNRLDYATLDKLLKLPNEELNRLSNILICAKISNNLPIEPALKMLQLPSNEQGTSHQQFYDGQQEMRGGRFQPIQYNQEDRSRQSSSAFQSYNSAPRQRQSDVSYFNPRPYIPESTNEDQRKNDNVLADYQNILPKVRAPGVDAPSRSNLRSTDSRTDERELQQQHFRQITQTSNPSRSVQQHHHKTESPNLYADQIISGRRHFDHAPAPSRQFESDEERMKKNLPMDVKPAEKPTPMYTESAFRNDSDNDSESDSDEEEFDEKEQRESTPQQVPISSHKIDRHSSEFQNQETQSQGHFTAQKPLKSAPVTKSRQTFNLQPSSSATAPLKNVEQPRTAQGPVRKVLNYGSQEESSSSGEESDDEDNDDLTKVCRR